MKSIQCHLWQICVLMAFFFKYMLNKSHHFFPPPFFLKYHVDLILTVLTAEQEVVTAVVGEVCCVVRYHRNGRADMSRGS